MAMLQATVPLPISISVSAPERCHTPFLLARQCFGYVRRVGAHGGESWRSWTSAMRAIVWRRQVLARRAVSCQHPCKTMVTALPTLDYLRLLSCGCHDGSSA
jgi:hypothetical protein